MNSQTLILTLGSISSDSSKNTTLKTIISSVTDIKWGDLRNIIACYSSDSSKVEAISFIVPKLTTDNKLLIEDYVSAYLPGILNQISSDSSKVAIIRTINLHINLVAPETLVAMVNTISSDSSKVDAINLLAPSMKATTSNIIRTILPVGLSPNSGCQTRVWTYH